MGRGCKRWHGLGAKVLSICRHPSSLQSVPLSVRQASLRSAPAAIRTSLETVGSNLVNGFGRARGFYSLPNFQLNGLSAKSLSTFAFCPSRKALCPWGLHCRGSGTENLVGAVAISLSNVMESSLHRSGVVVIHDCGLIRTASASTSYPSADDPLIDPEDTECPYTIFPSHNFALPTKSSRRAGASIGNTLLDTGNGMSRASKLPLHSALPSLRNHRVGELAFVGLQQGAEATAFMPAGEAVDWQQQRLGKWKDHDPRTKLQHSSPHSDAEPDDIFIPVKAFYISRSVDLKSLAREPFLEVTSSRNNLIIRCADRPPHSPVTADNPEMACLGFLKERYMVTFQYGSVVFFNFGDLEEVESLDIVRKYCSDEFREARKDDYGVLVRPTLQEWSEGGHDRVMLRKLDIDNIRVISSILGQSIALDHYAKKVDEMVTTFSELNRGMEQTGTFTMTRKSLFQLVAAANTTLADVILRLGLLERSDAAWKDANYAQIWEYLRDDFELDERFESLDFKLNIIQHNVRFFLEILQNRKSDTLEWIIILLITGEICVSLYDILHNAGAI